MPFYGSSVDLVVRDGRVVAFDEDLVQVENRFESEILEPFRAWVLDNHPEDLNSMFGPLHHSPESVALWAQHQKEYGASRIAAAEQYGDRAHEICTRSWPGPTARSRQPGWNSAPVSSTIP